MAPLQYLAHGLPDHPSELDLPLAHDIKFGDTGLIMRAAGEHCQPVSHEGTASGRRQASEADQPSISGSEAAASATAEVPRPCLGVLKLRQEISQGRASIHLCRRTVHGNRQPLAGGREQPARVVHDRSSSSSGTLVAPAGAQKTEAGLLRPLPKAARKSPGLNFLDGTLC